MLDRYKKEVLLLDIAGAQEELVIAFRRTLATICIIIENLAFFLIWLVTCIYSYMLKQCFTRVEIIFRSSMSEFNQSCSFGINLC